MKHRELFDRYVADLQTARTDALAWWDGLLARETKKTGSAEAAKQAVLRRWPYGPPSHPLVLAVFRKYCLACEQLNVEIEARTQEEEETIAESVEEDWGEADEEDEDEDEDEGDFWDDEGPVDTGTFLFDLLHGSHEELAEFMRYLAFSPIGIENGRSV